MAQLYPLKFKPIYKPTIWGGSKLNTVLGKDTKAGVKVGESWEISAVEGSLSVVSEGFLAGNSIQDLIEVYMGDLLGESVYNRFGLEFPLLIKFIDASDDLSIQVHPNDEVARERHNAYGKTEMWYVLQADAGSRLISGFAHDTNQGEYLRYLTAGTLPELMNSVEVAEGDVFFVPPGRVHAIGRGILLAEIQQTSDITYRIYDWGRLDAQGNSRELHTEYALDVIDYNFPSDAKKKIAPRLNETVVLESCQYFTTSVLEFNSPIEKDFNPIDSFVIYMNLGSDVDVVCNGQYTVLKKGETVLIPAEIKNLVLVPTATSKVLEIYISN